MFTSEQVEQIRELEGKYTQEQIGKIFNVDRRTIGKIFNGVSYRTPVLSIVEVVEEIAPAAPKVKMVFWSNT